MASRTTVLVTDYAWPDLAIERAIIEGAGYELRAGPAAPLDAAGVAALVEDSEPASILTCWAPVSAQAISASASLRHVGRIGVGLDNIDRAACAERGVIVTNVPDYCVEDVSDHAVAFALAWARGIVTLDREVRAGHWTPSAAKLRRMSDLQVGIVGLGRIGLCTAQKLTALGCRVRSASRRSGTAATSPGSVELVPLDELLACSDVIVLHVPLTAQSHHLIDDEKLARMKAGALLINLSRGAVVDTAALIRALHGGHLGGAALDVVEGEPDVPPALREHSRVMFTPHVGFSSDASLAELRRRAAEEAVRVLRGEAPAHACPLANP